MLCAKLNDVLSTYFCVRWKNVRSAWSAGCGCGFSNKRATYFLSLSGLHVPDGF